MTAKDQTCSVRYSICVSGAAGGDTVESSKGYAERLGKTIAKRGHILTTGATVGLPFYAAKGAQEAGGVSVGFSPASSMREHLRKYRLPCQYFDFISYTGMNYVGRDAFLIQSSDAIITVGGRFGSLHEFVTALEAHKPCGILLESGGTADIVPELMKVLETPSKHLVIYDKNPENLVNRMVDLLDEEYKDIGLQIARNEHWYLAKDASERAG